MSDNPHFDLGENKTTGKQILKLTRNPPFKQTKVIPEYMPQRQLSYIFKVQNLQISHRVSAALLA